MMVSWKFLAMAAGCALGAWGVKFLMIPPFIWVVCFFLLMFAAGFLAAAFAFAPLKYLCLALMTFFMVLAGFETVLIVQGRNADPGEYVTDNLTSRTDSSVAYMSNWERNPVLGYGPKPEKTIVRSCRAFKPSKHLPEIIPLYDVVYSTLDSGWRVTPQHPEARTAVVFLGCSFTFGEGLQDEESFPYQVGKMLGSDYQSYNFGFHGYGSHQMLAFIQAGGLDAIAAKHQKLFVFFSPVVTHEQRSSGVTPWSTHDPRYVLVNGEVVRRGYFSDDPGVLDTWFSWFATSHSYRKLKDALRAQPQDTMVRLYTGIVAAARRELKQRFGADLVMVFWPPTETQFAEAVNEAGSFALRLDQAIPELVSQRETHIIGKHDQHPNALANRKVAEVLTNYIKNAGIDVSSCSPPAPR